MVGKVSSCIARVQPPVHLHLLALQSENRTVHVTSLAPSQPSDRTLSLSPVSRRENRTPKQIKITQLSPCS